MMNDMGKSARILLAEDNELNQNLVTRMLDKMGYACDIAGDGRQAVELFTGGNYDVIFMDGQMPVMDGYEATRRIREIERCERKESAAPKVTIIAMTANDADSCKESGMDDYLSKPLSFKSLEQMLQKWA